MREEQMILGALLICAAIGIGVLCIGYRQRLNIGESFGLSKLSVVTSHTLRFAYFVIAAFSLIAIFLIPAAEKRENIRSAHIIFLVDTSKSQAAELPLGTQNSIERAKEIVQSICDVFPDIRTSLYAFTDVTRSHAYFSESAKHKNNCGYLRKTLENVVGVESVAGQGSDIARGLAISAASFPKEAKSKILVLFSDGEYTGNEKDFVQAFATVRNQNIRLLIVGMGYENGAYIPVYDKQSRKIVDVERTSGGKKVVAALRPDVLKAIAKEVNGKYFSENQKSELLKEIEQNLVETREVLENFYSPWKLPFLTGFFLGTLLFVRSVL